MIGLSLAWELRRRGLGTLVLDQGQAGQGCSWAGAGILPPARLETALDPIDRLRGLSHQRYPAWTAMLCEETGIDPQFQRCGGIYLARTPGELASLVGQAEYWREYGIDAFPLTKADLCRREPALAACLEKLRFREPLEQATPRHSSRPPFGAEENNAEEKATLRGSAAAWWVPDECQVRPPRLLKALLAACRGAGVRVLEKTPVEELLMASGSARVHGVKNASGEFHADHVVLCCGPWSCSFADPRGRLENVYPVRGQVVLYRGKPGLLTAVINEGNRYLVPRLDGRIYVGSSEEEVGFEPGTTAEVIEGLSRWGEGLLPALCEIPREMVFSGFRPGSFDGFPYIGRWEGLENLYVASGHFRSGLHFSVGTAIVLAELILGDVPSIPLDAFRVGR